MIKHAMIRTASLALATLLLVSGSALAAQPGAPGEERRPPRAPEGEASGPPKDGERGIFDPEAMRTRLERRMEEITREQTRIREALERLAKGESPEEVGRGMPIGRRPGRSEGREDVGREGHLKPHDGPHEPGRGLREGSKDGERAPKDGPSSSPRGEMSAEEQQVLLDVLKEAMPKLGEKVAEAIKADPEAGRRMLSRWAPRLREAAELKRHDPELFQLRVSEMREGWGVIEASRAARELANTSHDAEADIAAKRSAAREALRAALTRQFDARLAMQSHEVSALAKRLEELKARLESQKASRDTKIDETTEKILKDRDLPLEPGGKEGSREGGKEGGRPRREPPGR